MEGRERDNAKRIHNSLEEEEVRRNRLIYELQVLQRAEGDFDWRM